jgi:tRNA dimethylallyltransferase
MSLPFPLIVGPTASGKTALAVTLAERLAERNAPGEIVTMDSMQVYRGMDVGTAKPTHAERRNIPHHLIDLIDPTKTFSVDRWLNLAEQSIADIRARNRTPIVVGGTHLYAKALLEGLFEGPPADPAMREALNAAPLAELRAELERIDPKAAERIHPNDQRRTVRAVEVYRATGTPISEHQQQWDAQSGPRDDALLVTIHWPTEELNRRINQRVRDMMTGGLLEETRALHALPDLSGTARQALGYKQLLAHLDSPPRGKQHLPLDDAVEQIKIETRRFAKNQRTWLRRLAASPPPAGSVVLNAAASDPAAWPGRVLQALDAASALSADRNRPR